MTRFRAVQGAGYAGAVCVLWMVTMLLGAWIYTKYRIAIRIPLERTGYWKTLGFFRIEGAHRRARARACCPPIGIFGRTRKIRSMTAPRKVDDGAARRHVLVRLPGRARAEQRARVSAHERRRPIARVIAIARRVCRPSAPSPWCSRSRRRSSTSASELGGWPLFTYHPGTNRIDLGCAAARAGEGPAMYWYGWIATTLIGAAAARLAGERCCRAGSATESRCF